MEADLLRRIGDIGQASQVLARLHGPATASSARAVARLHLSTGDVAAAEAVLAEFPDDDATVRGRVEGAVLRGMIAAAQDRAAALTRLEDRCSQRHRSGCGDPSWQRRRSCTTCSALGLKPEPRSLLLPWTWYGGCRDKAATRLPFWLRR